MDNLWELAVISGNFGVIGEPNSRKHSKTRLNAVNEPSSGNRSLVSYSSYVLSIYSLCLLASMLAARLGILKID